MSELSSNPYIGELFYVACLKTLLLAYIVPLSNNLQQTKCIDDGKDHSILLLSFGAEILKLLACHQAIFNELQAKSRDVADTSRHFPAALLKAASAMRAAYQTYVSRLSANMDLARHAKSAVPAGLWRGSYPALARGTLASNLLDLGLNEQHASAFAEHSNISLDALAVLPIRRIARYSVYLKEWMSTCSEKSIKDNVLETIAKIQNICSSVEEVQSASEHLKKLSQLEKTIGTKTKETMGFITEGDVEYVRCNKRCCGRVLLLTRALVVVYSTGKSYKSSRKVVEHIPLPSVLSVRRASPKIAGPCGFEVSYASQSCCPWKRRGSRRRVIVLAANEADAILWVRDITQAVDDLTRLE